jgi:hypothetical protein
MASRKKLCSFVRSNGALCAMNALEDARFCFYHQRARQRARILRNASDERIGDHAHGRAPVDAKAAPFDEKLAQLFQQLQLGSLDDAISIQAAIFAISNAMTSQHISEKLGGKLLYACQLAMTNLKNVQAELKAAENLGTAKEDTEPIYTWDMQLDKEVPEAQRERDKYFARLNHPRKMPESATPEVLANTIAG